MNNTNFRVRITALKASSTTCATARILRVDHLRIRVYYRWVEDVVTNPPVFHPDTNVAGPASEVLTPRGFWGMMLSQGAESISGDAYLPRYDTDGAPGPAVNNPNYDQVQYYNYAVEMAPGSSNGGVWIYDPGFCAGALTTGLGDTWIGNKVPVSSFYDLYDTQGTPYDLTDDVLVPGFTSGNTFKQQDGSDPTLNGSGGSGIAGCDAYHLGWYQLGGHRPWPAARPTGSIRAPSTRATRVTSCRPTHAMAGRSSPRRPAPRRRSTGSGRWRCTRHCRVARPRPSTWPRSRRPMRARRWRSSSSTPATPTRTPTSRS